MDKLLLLLLGAFPVMFFQGVAPSTLCMVCNNFKNGRCWSGRGNCTMEQGPGCRTRDFFIFSEEVGWLHNHSELDCEYICVASKLYFGDLMISSRCCKGQDFCNKYQSKLEIRAG